ncbi:MAG: UDP-3-O-[3-hydroxymyristoyl] N-acetylglucosamine deacetylase [Bacteroidia bacterium]|nr:MAG: UDP-3-O-[3-hydroxymyristoyl] N-acetylglucosamine deacetylase [Bacteroidia bacterium]
MSDKQRTIQNPVSVKGKGLHTGIEVEVVFKPASENHGYQFKRVDLDEQPIVHAIVENVVDTARSTIIEENGVRIGTVEHILSALHGLRIDNVLIEISGPETPIMDGSAKHYVEALTNAGIIEQNEDRQYFIPKHNITFTDEKNNIQLMLIPDEEFSINVMIDYNSDVLGNQYATLNSIDDYQKEISSCRTFVFLRDLEPLLKHNLIKGGDLDNAIVIVERKITQEELDRLADLFNKPRVKVKSQGVLNNIDLQFSNEPARHKLLDIMGDLALIGMPLKGKILATRPGHHANVEFARVIKKEIKKIKSKNVAPEYDVYAPSLMDINRIMQLLPHRPPFLLVDKVLEIKGNEEIVGVKNVTMNEPFFVGHFPEEPVMPGVLIIEAMAQVSGLMVLNTLPDPERYSTYFLKIDNIKFRRKVVPGDTIIFKVKMLAPIRRGITEMRGKAFVGPNVVAEGEFMAQIVKNK